MDVADAIGAAVAEEDVAAFLRRRADLVDRPVTIPGRNDELIIPSDRALDIIRTYLPAVQAAGRIYRRIREARNEDSFIPEISMDETDRPQGPAELLLILAAVADEGIPIQTIAPRFPGRFNKGVEYVGDPELFGREFESDIQVVRYAAGAFGFPENLKLSVHSGSDKFAVYPEINRLIRSYGVGVHLKTAGTNWCEEIVGLAEAGGDGLDLAKTVYREAHKKREALCGPYAEVIDIQDSRLPDPRDVATWDSERFVRSLRHEPDELYNADFRQLIHVGYKVAAGMGPVFLDALAVHRSSVARNVTHNLYERHLKPIFGGL